MFYSKEDIKALGYDSEVAFVVDYGKKHGNMIARFSSDGVYLDYDFDVQVGVPNIGHVPQPINTRQYPRKNYRLKKEDKMSEWISVKERVPKLDESVIACTEHGRVFEAVRIRSMRRTFWTNAVWGFSPAMCEHTGAITHWMPFPAPPEGGAEE